MLHNTPDSSNSEVLIIFPGQFDINSWIIEVSTIYRRKKLSSLELGQKMAKFLSFKHKSHTETPFFLARDYCENNNSSKSGENVEQ